jgi:hypothetical protein
MYNKQTSVGYPKWEYLKGIHLGRLWLYSKYQARLLRLPIVNYYSLKGIFVSDKVNSFVTLAPGACNIKLLTAACYNF